MTKRHVGLYYWAFCSPFREQLMRITEFMKISTSVSTMIMLVYIPVRPFFLVHDNQCHWVKIYLQFTS